MTNSFFNHNTTNLQFPPFLSLSACWRVLETQADVQPASEPVVGAQFPSQSQLGGGLSGQSVCKFNKFSISYHGNKVVLDINTKDF